MNTAATQKLYDQNTISNQQYDNTKRALRNNLLNQTTSGITNMMKTDAMNQLYPQFDVDASSGGKVTYDPTKARQVKPEYNPADDAKLYAECEKYGLKDQALVNCVNNKKKSMGSGDETDDSGLVNAHFSGQTPTKKTGGFVYGDITYPFIL